MKHKLLMAHLKEEEPIERVIADVSVIEFQKRDLVYAHIIIFLHDDPKTALENPDRVDEIISAEIPYQNDPFLRQAVLRHLIQKPCTDDVDAVCVRAENAHNGFLKHFG